MFGKRQEAPTAETLAHVLCGEGSEQTGRALSVATCTCSRQLAKLRCKSEPIFVYRSCTRRLSCGGQHVQQHREVMQHAAGEHEGVPQRVLVWQLAPQVERHAQGV